MKVTINQSMYERFISRMFFFSIDIVVWIGVKNHINTNMIITFVFIYLKQIKKQLILRDS